MSVLGRLAGLFGSEVRSRGREYQRRGAVRLTRQTPDALRASVQGTRSYRVDVAWDGGDFEYQCTCPFAQEYGEPCKHVWATLLEADERGALPGGSPVGRPEATNGDERASGDAGHDNEEDRADGDEASADDDGDENGDEAGADMRPLPSVLRDYVQNRMPRSTARGGGNGRGAGGGG